MLEDGHYVSQHLGDPIFVDVAGLGSYSHWLWWLWTNLALLFILAAAFFAVPPPFDKRVDAILDPNRTSLPIV